MLLPALSIVEHEILPAPNRSLRLAVAKTGLFNGKKHLFSFPRYRGTVRFDRDSPPESSVELEIDARSLVVEDDWVSEQDRAKIKAFTLEQILQASRFPWLRFQSAAVRAAGDEIRVTGGLTVRDVKRTVAISLRLEEASAAGLAFAGHCLFPMSAFGIKPPSAAFGAIGTRDEMELSFELQTQPR